MPVISALEGGDRRTMSSVSRHNLVLSGLLDTFLKHAQAYTETEREGGTGRQTEKCKIKLECTHHFLTSVLGKKEKEKEREKEKEKIHHTQD